jgi:adenylate kinase
MQSGGSPNRAVIQLGVNGYGNSTALGNTDNGAFIGNVSFNYSDIDFSDATKRLQLNDVLTLSITEA